MAREAQTNECDVHTVQGFDEFMNVVLDEAEEIYLKDAAGKSKKSGERVSLGMSLSPLVSSALRPTLTQWMGRNRPTAAQGREHHAYPTRCMMS